LYRVVGVEHVGGRGVVHDDDLVQVAAQPTQVLHVVPPVEDARLAEQAAPEGPPLVQEVGHGIRILGGGESPIKCQVKNEENLAGITEQ